MSDAAEKLLKVLIQKVERMESLLIEREMKAPTKNTKEAAAYLGMSVSTLHKKTSRKNMEIPCSKTGSKNKLFFTRDLDNFIEKTKAKAA